MLTNLFLPYIVFFILVFLSNEAFFKQDIFFSVHILSIPPINILEVDVLHDIMQTAAHAIRNDKTGNFYFLPITVDSLRVDLAVEQFCSILRFGFPKSAVIYISYDSNACRVLRIAGAKCTTINISKVKILRGYKKFLMKVYLLYVQNWWGFDSYTLDSDVIFFDHIEKAFQNNIDIEISSNFNLAYSQYEASKKKRVNSGFGRYLPSIPATSVLHDLWNFASKQTNLRDQLSHEHVYSVWRKHTKFFKNGVETWEKNGTIVTFRIIDPIKVSPGGLSMCKGRNKYWNLIKQHSKVKFSMPIALHFNYQIGNKYHLYKFLGLKMCHVWNQEVSNILKKKIMEIKCMTLFGCVNCYLNTT